MNQDSHSDSASTCAREIWERVAPQYGMPIASLPPEWIREVISRFLKSHEEQVREEYKQLAIKWHKHAAAISNAAHPLNTSPEAYMGNKCRADWFDARASELEALGKGSDK